MELSKQVCSLESAKRLKELGVEQNSYFRHVEWRNQIWDSQGVENGGWPWLPDDQRAVVQRIWDEGVCAFTVAELGEMLPKVVKKDDKLYYIEPSANGNGLKYIDYTTYNEGIGTFLRAYPLVGADTEAEARAKMLIYLLENNLYHVQ